MAEVIDSWRNEKGILVKVNPLKGSWCPFKDGNNAVFCQNETGCPNCDQSPKGCKHD